MFQTATNFLALWIASFNVAPNRIPLSGWSRLRSRNYFAPYAVSPNGKTYFLVHQINLQSIRVTFWSDSLNRPLNAKNPTRNLGNFGIKIEQYFGDLSWEFSDPLAFILFQLLQLKWVLLARSRTERFFFNRKMLARQDRLEVLRNIVADTIERPRFSTDQFQYLSSRYGSRIFTHPQRESLVKYYELIFDSLVASGELYRDGSSYKLCGTALETLSKAAASDRQHDDAMQQQKKLNKLTYLIAIATIANVLVAIWSGIK